MFRERLKELAAKYVTPMVAEDMDIFLDFLDQHGFKIKPKEPFIDDMMPPTKERYIAVRIGVKRVEDPNATQHPCSHCGKMMTLAFYDVVDGYVVTKAGQEASPELLAEHDENCDWRIHKGKGTTEGDDLPRFCRHCRQAWTHGHTCIEMIENISAWYSQQMFTKIEALYARLMTKQMEASPFRIEYRVGEPGPMGAPVPKVVDELMEKEDKKVLKTVRKAAKKSTKKSKGKRK